MATTGEQEIRGHQNDHQEGHQHQWQIAESWKLQGKYSRGVKKCAEKILHGEKQREECKILLAEKQERMAQKYFKQQASDQ